MLHKSPEVPGEEEALALMKDVQAHVSLVSDDFLKRELALMQGLRMGRLLLEIQGHQPSGDSSVLLEWTLPPFPFSASFRVGSVLRISKEAGLAASRSSHRNQVILHSEQLP